MSEKSKTEFPVRCEILSDLWLEYRMDEELKDFVSYNDIGLPAAFLVSEKLAEPSDGLTSLIDETFELLLVALGHQEDTGFESLDDVLVG